MPPKLVRVTFDHENSKSFIVEYGALSILSPEDRDEMILLQQDLLEFKDFASAETLDDARRHELMDKKKRLKVLNEINDGNEILWSSDTFTNSVLLILRPDYTPIYVENLPNELFDKLLLESQFTMNVTPVAAPAEPVQYAPLQYEYEPVAAAPPPQNVSQSDPQLERVKRIITSIKDNPAMSANKDQPWLATKTGGSYNGLIYVSRIHPGPGQSSLDGVIYAWPVKYLKTDWEPVNQALKDALGDNVDWVRTEPGKWSHWVIT